ncbi:MAG: GNAT family N-acetyltransferase [Alphaproteobacteria bacterium]
MLQEHERLLHDGLLPGAAIAAPYLAYLERQVARHDGVLLVAERGGAVVGFVACLIERYDGPEEAPDSAVYGLVSDIAVSPAARRQGIGQALLAAAEAHARGRGMARLRVHVLSANEEARAAYRRFGFMPYTEELEKRLR